MCCNHNKLIILSTSRSFVPLPRGSEVSGALTAAEGHWLCSVFFVVFVENLGDALLEAQQTNKF